MAVDDKKLPVQWFKQKTLYFCGPAVAQMFLDYVQVNETQQNLWQYIISKTIGTRPPDAPATGHEFPNQVCDTCDPNSTDPERWKCWDTTPEALSATVSDRGGLPLAAQYAPNFVSGVEMLIDSIKRTPQVPAFATIYLVNHWVIVTGYRLDDDSSIAAPIMPVGKYNVNGLYIGDPMDAEIVQHFSFVPIRSWQSEFGLVGCGVHMDTRPIVVRGLPIWVRFVAVVSGALLLFALWKWWRHR